MNKIVPVAVAAVCALCLATGCSNTETPEKEITSVSNAEPLAVATGWSDVADEFATLDAEAQQEADAVTASTVRDTVNENVQVLIDNLDTLTAASQSGEIDATTEQAAKDVYKAAGVLDALGDDDAEDVGLYIEDISVDAHYLLRNLYDEQPADFEGRRMEVIGNRDRISYFDDDEWQTYIDRVTA